MKTHLATSTNNDDHVNSWCGLGDSHDRGFEKGTVNIIEVDCKNCLKVWKRMTKKLKQ